MAVQHIKIEAITPVYIGGAAEKNFQKDIDVFYEKGMLYYIPNERLAPFTGDRELQLVVNGKFEDYKNAIKRNGANFEKLALYKWKTVQESSQNEIKAFIRNGKGQPFIPGSSLKGAITSHLFKLLNKTRSGKLIDVASFLQLTDAHFPSDATSILPTKIYNLQEDYNIKDKIGGWKHGRYSNEQFKNKGFVIYYETLKTGALGFGRLKLVDKENFSFEDEKVGTKVKALNWWESENNADQLFKIINQNTLEHLEKELAFYEKYEAEHSEKIIEEIEKLIEVCESQTDSAILRVGGGSGFHSITGDYIHDDYAIDGFGYKSRGTRNKVNSAKSRKLASQTKGDEESFSPLGFVKISKITEEEFEKQRQLLNEKSAEIEEQTEAVVKETPKPIEPEWVEFDSLKERDVIDAEIVKDENGIKTVKLFINNISKQFDFRFFAPIEIGTIIRVEIKNFSGKGANRKIQNIGFKEIKE